MFTAAGVESGIAPPVGPLVFVTRDVDLELQTAEARREMAGLVDVSPFDRLGTELARFALTDFTETPGFVSSSP